MTFEEWLRAVDRIVSGICGIGQADGSDWCSRDAYDGGETPAQGALAWAECQDDLPDELMGALIAQAQE